MLWGRKSRRWGRKGARGESIKGREVTSGLWEASCLEKSIKPTLTLTHTRTTRVIFYCVRWYQTVTRSSPYSFKGDRWLCSVHVQWYWPINLKLSFKWMFTFTSSMCLHVWPIRSQTTCVWAEGTRKTQLDILSSILVSWAAAHLSLKHTAQSNASAY